MRQQLSRFLTPFLTVAALALSACDDRSIAPTAPDAALVPPRDGALRDAGIVTNDSWLTAQVITTTDGVGTNTASVEAGYGNGGEFRFGVYWTPTVPSSALAGIRYVGDRVDLLNAAGAVIGTNTFNGYATEIGLPGGSLVGAILQTQDPGEPTCQPSDPGCFATVVSDAAVGDARARSTDERRLRRRVRPARTTTALSGDGDYADVERVYRRQRPSDGSADLWRLEELNEERRITTDRGVRVQRTTTKIRYTRYQMKATREAARAVAFRETSASASARSTVRAPSPAALREASVPFAGDDADGILDPFCRQGTRNDHVLKAKSSRGLSIVYQHGFCSDAAAWDGVRPRMGAAVSVLRERAYSLNSTVRIEQQATDLIGLIAEAGPTRSIIIGHSQGGLVARRVGQRAPEYVSSVITIGSPQTGSLLAALGPETINSLVEGIGGEMCATDFLCDLVAGAVEQHLNGRLHVALLENGAPSLQDLVPESPFLQTLNSTHEPFARASVETDVGNRWALARMIGDGRSPVTGLLTDQRPAGDAWVTRAEKTYYSAQAMRFLSMFSLFWREGMGNGVNCAQSAYATYWEPCVARIPSNQGASWWQEILAVNTILLTSIIIAAMDAIDGAWDYATTRRAEGTDGLIDAYSQRYPETPGTFTPERFRVMAPQADSHSGQLASPSTFQRTLDAVRSIGTKNP